MSLRLRLILTFGALIFALMVAQLLMVRRLSSELSGEVDLVAFSMGRDVVSAFVTDEQHEVKNADDVQIITMEPKPGEVRIRREFHWTHSGDVTSEIKNDKALLDLVTVELQVDQKSNQGTNYVVLKSDDIDHRIPIPKRGIQETIERVSLNLVIGSMVLIMIGLVAVGYLAHRATAPLRQLAVAAHQVGAGELGVQVDASSVGGEEGLAIDAFNQMSSQLYELDHESRILREKQAMSELGEIARGLAHTIRNPLNAIGLSMDQLASLSGNSDEAQALAGAGRRQIKRVDQWIRSFLSLANDSGCVHEWIDFSSLTQEVMLNLTQDGMSHVGLEFKSSGDDLKIWGVLPELRSLIHAIVVNAMEASPDQGIVTVEVLREDDKLILVVEDSGPGVPAHIKERLFTPHVTSKSHGSGMGLFLAQRIAQNKYNGKVSLEDRQPNGTRAVITLHADSRN
ncbi:MAG: HAMP domain-containing histidine kinase [Acidobacteria bacterium]|nr:HAMP domain-containing histidine kinase [Acidobacteriota bacterium]